MKKLSLFLIGAFILMHHVSSAQKHKRPATSQATKVYQVNSVELTVVKKDQNGVIHDELVLRATGETNTGGWTNAKLKPTFSVNKVEDGIYRFDFVATPPLKGEDVTQMMSPVTGEYVFKTIPDNFVKVIVYAETNSKEKSYKATAMQPARTDVSCNESQPGTLVFNTGGDYRVTLQHLEMADRHDANLCVGGSKTCWDHLQNYTVGSGRDFNGIKEGSTLAVYSTDGNTNLSDILIMDKVSCPPKEGFVFYSDASGFRMTLKVEKMETTMQ